MVAVPGGCTRGSTDLSTPRRPDNLARRSVVPPPTTPLETSYPADDDCEHLTWEQLAALLKTSAKREKKKGSHKEGAAGAAWPACG